EHISAKVLKYMGKPAGKTYDKFREKFFKINEQLGKKQYIIPYLMSSHPGSTLDTAIELAEYLRDIHYQPEQVQDFYPTPGTLSTTMFYTGLDPMTMEEVYIPRTKEEKAMQRALLQFSNPKKYDIVYAALVKAEREDLIGHGPKCLIRPREDRFSRGGYKGQGNGRGQGVGNNQGAKKGQGAGKGQGTGRGQNVKGASKATSKITGNSTNRGPANQQGKSMNSTSYKGTRTAGKSAKRK
ncbi:MAG: DUF3362 domain-containing protein, partial [Niameybacter sp.]